MALVIGIQSKWVPWPEAEAELLLAPLSPAKKQQFESDCRLIERDANGAPISARRDVAKYQQLVGRECIRGWRPLNGKGGVLDTSNNPLPYSPEAAEALMMIEPAAHFVVGYAEGLELHLRQETAAAGKG